MSNTEESPLKYVAFRIIILRGESDSKENLEEVMNDKFFRIYGCQDRYVNNTKIEFINPGKPYIRT